MTRFHAPTLYDSSGIKMIWGKICVGLAAIHPTFSPPTSAVKYVSSLERRGVG